MNPSSLAMPVKHTSDRRPSNRLQQVTPDTAMTSVDAQPSRISPMVVPSTTVHSDDKYQVYGEQRDAARRQHDDRFDAGYDKKNRVYDDTSYESNSQSYYNHSSNTRAYNSTSGDPHYSNYPDSRYPDASYPDAQYVDYSHRQEVIGEIQYSARSKDPQEVRRQQTMNRYKTSKKPSYTSKHPPYHNNYEYR